MSASVSSRIALSVVALAFVSCGPKLHPEDVKKGQEIAVGDPAPDFTLASATGEEISLSSLGGRIVVIYFYPKDETPGCTKQACSFRDNMEAFEAMDASVLGISLDSTESHEKFKKANRLNFPLLSDPTGKTVTAYGAWKAGATRKSALSINRSTFVLDREGVIRRIWRDVDVVGHADEVLAFAQTL